jgi:hypothetical protein
MPVFVRPDGTCVETAPAMPRWHHEDADPLAPTAALLTTASAAIGPYTATARGDGAPFNVAWAIDVLRLVTAQIVARRRSELGVRLALGAPAGFIVKLIVRGLMRLVAVLVLVHERSHPRRVLPIEW